MSSAQATGPRWPTTITRFATISGLIALVVLAVAGPGYRVGVLPLQIALLATAFSFVLLMITFLVGSVGLVAGRLRSVRTSYTALAITLFAGLATVLATVWLARVRSAPPIHDITTDTEDPPAFTDIVALRQAAGATNSVEYQPHQRLAGREINVIEAQRQAYPDVKPLILKQAPARALEIAEQAAQAMGWDVVAAVMNGDRVEGRVEATDTTWYFGFKDDVVIRVRPERNGSRVDVRSVSRVGLGDVGTNARRINDYLTKLRELADS